MSPSPAPVVRTATHLLLLSTLIALPARRASPQPAPRPDPLLALADRVVAEVAALRGLPVKVPVDRGVLRRDELLDRIRRRVREEYTPEEVRAEGFLLERLGLLPPGTEYEETVFALLEEQVAGYYDTRERRLYLASWLEPEMQVQTLSHEVEHALQDQHFSIGDRLRAARRNGDRRAALSALAEGDGIAVMFDFLARGTGRDFTTMPNLLETLRAQAESPDGQPVLARSPRVLREILLFPYLSGVSFVRALKRRGGWHAVDEAFRSPPDSTEQILHPERFLHRDAPTVVSVPALPALEATHEETYRDVLGELQVRLALEETLRGEVAASAAAGWDGDEAVLFVRRGTVDDPGLADLSLVLRTVWDPGRSDEEAEAREAASALARSLALRFPRARSARTSRGEVLCLPDGTVALVERRGREVLYLEGIPAAATEAVRRQAWGRGDATSPRERR